MNNNDSNYKKSKKTLTIIDDNKNNNTNHEYKNNNIGNIDGYETIDDYSLLEQVRDAIEDIELTTIKSKNNKTTSSNSNISNNNGHHTNGHTSNVNGNDNHSPSISLIDNHVLFDKICMKMNVKSQRTKERITSAMDEINAHETFEVFLILISSLIFGFVLMIKYIIQYIKKQELFRLNSESSTAPMTDIDKIDSDNMDSIDQTER